MKNKEKKEKEGTSVDQKIDRKRAIKRAGFYAATAASMVILIGSPKKSPAASLPPPPPAWD
jgi:hypothetical protein